MRWDSVELHGIAEVREADGEPGLRLQRVPEEVRQRLWEGAARVMLSPSNAEIRFVIEEGEASVTISGAEQEHQGEIFFGGFDTRQRFTLGKQPMTLRVRMPEPLKNLPQHILDQQAFAPHVCRIMLPYLAPEVYLHGVEGKVRPPRLDETPKVRLLAYGTSITHGAFATAPHLTYPAQTAWRLGADLLNLGVAGTCHCDPALADHIAKRDDWDLATLCLSVNMLGYGYTAEGFRERARHFIEKVASSGRRRPVVCITLFPFFGDMGRTLPSMKADPEEYRRVLRDVVHGLGMPNVSVVEGPDLLSQWSGLAADLLHPADSGMIEIGEKLAARLKEMIR